MNTGVNFNLLMRQKIFYEKDNEVNPGRSNYVRQTCVGWTTMEIIPWMDKCIHFWNVFSTLTKFG